MNEHLLSGKRAVDPSAEAAGDAGVFDRRRFLAVAGAVASVWGATASDAEANSLPAADPHGADAVSLPHLRKQAAYQVRVDAARWERSQPIREQSDNGDEQRYPSRIANYSKGLPHAFLGEVDPYAYDSLLRALASRRPSETGVVTADEGAEHCS